MLASSAKDYESHHLKRLTGYMFGKGVYFADIVTKSANYCFAKDDGLMLLCEVALGEMQEENDAKMIVKPNKGKHSVKGVGKTTPDPSGVHKTIDNVIVPMGKPKTLTGHKTLLYNEYIVYDTAQIQMKYLIRMEFNTGSLFG